MGAGPSTSSDASASPHPSDSGAGAQLSDSDRTEVRSLASTDQPIRKRVRQILKYTVDRLGLELGYLTYIDPGPATQTVIDVSNSHPRVSRGDVRPLAKTFCRRVIASGGPVCIPDAPRTCPDDPAVAASGFASYVGAKVLVGRSLYGTVCFVSDRARAGQFSTEQRALVEHVADHVGRLLERMSSPPSPTRSDSAPPSPLVGGWTLSTDPPTLTWTEETYRIHGASLEYEPTIASAIRFYPSEARIRLRDALRRCFEKGTPFELDVPLTTNEGARRRVRLTGVAHRENDRVTHVSGTIRNLEGAVGHHSVQTVDAETLRQLVRTAEPIVFLLDDSGTILVSEGATLEVLGLEPGEHVGDSVYDLYADDPALLAHADRALSGSSGQATVEIGDRMLDAWYAPIHDENGAIAGCIGMAVDVTQRNEMRRELRDREAWLRSITENVREGIYRTTPDEGLVYVNSSFATMFGYDDAEEVLAQPLEILYANPERSNPLFEVAAQNDPQTRDITFRRQDGTTFTGQVSGSVIRDERGQIEYVDGVVSDVSRLREKERELEETKARYKSVSEDVLDTSPVGTFILDDERTIVWINQAVEAYLGVDRNRVVGMSYEAFLEQTMPGCIEDPSAFLDAVQPPDASNTGPNTSECHVLPGDDREERWLEHQSTPIEHGWYEGGRVETYTDITRLKSRQQALRDERDLLNRVFETSPSAIAIFNREGDFIRVSDRAKEILGIGKETVTNRSFRDPDWRIAAPDGSDFPEENLPFARVKTTGEPVIGVEHAIHWPDGTRRLLSVSGAPLLDAKGRFQGAVFHLDDITERRQTAINLRKSEQRFRGLFEDAALGVALLEENGTIVEANSALEAMVGYEDGTLEGMDFGDITHPDDLSTDQALFGELASGTRDQYQIEKRCLRKDGSVFWGRLTVSRRDTPDAIEIIGMVENIDSRKKQKEELRKFHKVVEHAHEAVLILDGDTHGAPGPTITYANPAFRALTGYDPKDIIGEPLALLHGPDTESWILEDLWASIEAGDQHEGEAINYRKDGSRFVNRWGLAPVHDENGDITHWVFVQRDVTKERRMDKRLLHVEDAERRRIDQEMHDQMGGLLTTLQMTVDLGRMEAGDEHPALEHFDKIESLLDELSAVTRTISRRLHPKVLDDHGLNRALSTLTSTIQNQHEVDVTVYSEVCPDDELVPLVEMTAYRVVQEALVNIARHAETTHAQVMVNKDGNQLRIHVIEEGAGFDLTEDEQASSLGLQGIRERAERLNGTLNIVTAPGEGTRISVTLPLRISSLPK